MRTKMILVSLMLLIVMMTGFLYAGEPVTFSVTGDYPYEDEISILERHIFEHNLYSPSNFWAHVGDFFAQDEPSWGEQRFADVAARLKRLKVPAFVVIGDNDWTDSPNPAQGFQWWWQYFAYFDANWPAIASVERQSVRQENWAFVLKGVLFVGINYTGSSGGTQEDDANWLEFQFADKAGQIRAAVVFGHKGPTLTLNSLFTRFRDASIALNKPVFYIQGHDHHWQFDKPWLAPNMQRLTVERGGNEDPVQITVNMDLNNPFEIRRTPWKTAFVAATKFKADKYGDFEGDVHSNENIEIKKGLPSVVAGNLTAVKDIKIETSNTINGNVTAGQKLDIKSGAIINGTASGNKSVLRVLLPKVSFSASGSDIKLSDDETRALAPGSYNNVEVGKRGTLMLSGGEYFIKRLIIKESAVISANVATQEITLNVVEEIKFEKWARVDITPGGENGSRYFALKQVKDKDIVFDEDSRFWGSIVAPLAKVMLGKSAGFKGRIVAKEIEATENTALLSHSSTLSLPKAAAPYLVFGADSDGGGEETPPIPSGYSLSQNYPNPFNPATRIDFSLPISAHVVMRVRSILGQEIQTLVDMTMTSGTHSVIWDGRDYSGNPAPSGVYFYQIKAADFVQVKKMSLVR